EMVRMKCFFILVHPNSQVKLGVKDSKCRYKLSSIPSFCPSPKRRASRISVSFFWNQVQNAFVFIGFHFKINNKVAHEEKRIERKNPSSPPYPSASVIRFCKLVFNRFKNLVGGIFRSLISKKVL